MTPLRVAQVLASSAGGTGRHAAMLARGLAERGAAVSVYGPEPARGLLSGPAGPAGRASPGDGSLTFTAVWIAARPRPADPATVLRLRALLRQAAPDVVHAHGLRAGAAAALAGAGRGRPPLVVTVHNAPPPGLVSRAVYAALARLTAQRADLVLTVSADLAGQMTRSGARAVARAVVPAPPGAPQAAAAIAAARAACGPAGRPVVLAVARLTAQKGLDVLLDAAASWPEREPVPQLVIAGQGPLARSLAERSRARGLDAVFLGARDDVPALLAAADVIVVPSRWEGQPLLVQEALQAGRPLVATQTGGIPELTGADAALLVPAGDCVALAAAVRRVLDDPALAARLAAAALTRAGALPSVTDALDAATASYARVRARCQD